MRTVWSEDGRTAIERTRFNNVKFVAYENTREERDMGRYHYEIRWGSEGQPAQVAVFDTKKKADNYMKFAIKALVEKAGLIGPIKQRSE